MGQAPPLGTFGPLGGAALKEDNNTSSAELVYGCKVTVLGQFLDTPEPLSATFLWNSRIRSSPPRKERSYIE
jgi:hypothetical protein